MKTRNTQRNRGFTLIEVLLVILIIGMLAAVLAVTIGGTSEGARIDTTKLAVQKVASKLDEYYIHVGHYPTESEGGLKALINKPGDEKSAEKWRGPYAKAQELQDSWGNQLNYEASEAGAEVAPGVKFKLWSNGPDQQSNTADDITNYKDQGK